MACTVLMATGALAQEQKTVVAYFSATGTTEKVASSLAKEHKADLYKIEPKEVYSSADLNWRDKQSRSTLEMNDKSARPALKEAKSLAGYDVIYLGYPIWWDMAPRIIDTFIEQAQIDGKKVFPFATSGGSSIVNSVRELKLAYPDVKWQAGVLMNDENY